MIIQQFLLAAWLAAPGAIQPAQTQAIPPVTLINNIRYTDATFTGLPGNGFLLDTGEEILAVTCKHVLWENRPPDLKTVNLAGRLAEWKMVVPDAPGQYVLLGALINEDGNETIGDRNTERDYLVFEIKENHSGVKPLKISPRAAAAGESVVKTGWSFQHRTGPPLIRPATARGYAGASLLLQNQVRQNDAGLSGSPVLNQKGELVGIVSSWKYDYGAKTWREAACSTDYLREVLYHRWLKKQGRSKDPASFAGYLSHDRKMSGVRPDVSSHLYTELFYTGWLKDQGLTDSSQESFNRWTASLKHTLGLEISADPWRKSWLIFSGWRPGYRSGRLELPDLMTRLQNEDVFFPDWLVFCELAEELIRSGQSGRAIALLVFTDERVPHPGTVQAYLGDACRANGQPDRAREAYEKCLQAYPGYPRAMEGLAALPGRRNQ